MHVVLPILASQFSSETPEDAWGNLGSGGSVALSSTCRLYGDLHSSERYPRHWLDNGCSHGESTLLVEY